MISKNNISREQIIDAENRLLEAIKISDINALDGLLHNDLLFITPDGQTITKGMDLESHRSGTMVVEEIIPSIEQINIIEDIAVAIIVYRSKGKMMGQPIEGDFRYIRIWRQFGHSLKVVGGSCTKV